MTDKKVLKSIKKLLDNDEKDRVEALVKQNEILKELVTKKDMVCIDYMKKQTEIENILKNMKISFESISSDNKKLQQTIDRVEENIKIYSKKDYFFLFCWTVFTAMVTYMSVMNSLGK